MLPLASAFSYRFWGMELLKRTFVPGGEVAHLKPLEPADYSNPAHWLARPDKPGNPALWAPDGFTAAPTPPAAVFFVHPTTFLDPTRWNAPIDHREAAHRAEIFLRGQASAFNDVGAIWAPRYRQATYGAFLTDSDKAQRALAMAYRDVLAAFEAFLEQAGDRPILLAGHSQGSLHLSRLLAERIAGRAIARRIVAAYIVGWPLSLSADLPAMGLKPCARADQANCILSWQSYATPADPRTVLDTFDAGQGYAGIPRKGTDMLCVNPITGKPGDTALPEQSLGTLIPDPTYSTAQLVPHHVGAWCEGRGILNIGLNPPDVGPYVLPGNNYHVFDYTLFWADVRADATRRLKAFGKGR